MYTVDINPSLGQDMGGAEPQSLAPLATARGRAHPLTRHGQATLWALTDRGRYPAGPAVAILLDPLSLLRHGHLYSLASDRGRCLTLAPVPTETRETCISWTRVFIGSTGVEFQILRNYKAAISVSLYRRANCRGYSTL